MNKRAFDVGRALGMLKAGSVERVERQNAKLVKIAKLLRSKGKLAKKAEFKWPWSSEWGYTPSKEEQMKQVNDLLREEAGRLESGAARGEGYSPLRDAAKGLRVQAEGGKLKMPSGAPKPKEKPSDVISLDMDPAERRRIQQRGVTPKKPQPQRKPKSPADSEAGFYGGPEFGDIKRYWMQMMGMSPAQLSAQQSAREAGYGRALRHKVNLDWLKSMLLGPQMGHYGTGM